MATGSIYSLKTDIIRLYEQGHNVLSIAKKLSVKAPYVYNVLMQYLKGKDEKGESDDARNI